jgi:hypothetical protein
MGMNIIEEAIGRDAYELLCAWAGGGDYCIPSQVESGQAAALAEHIGREAAHALIRWGAGGRVYVPNQHSHERQRRQADILARREAGATIPEIARSYRYSGRYTERQILALLGEATSRARASACAESVQDSQPPLF